MDRDIAFWLVLGGGAIAALWLLDGNVYAPQQPPTTGNGEPPPPNPEPVYLNSDDERTALARVIRSEAANHTLTERVAIGCIARNHARRKGVTIAQLVCQPCGRQGHGRHFSSHLSPRAIDLDLAAEILRAPAWQDPTLGATNALEPKLQDELFAHHEPGYTKNADMVRADWTRTLEKYGSVGRWELYGPKRRPQG